jgi:hypothetical protein
MLLGKNTFPATDITIEQLYTLDTILTHPAPSPEKTDYFLENMGRPLLRTHNMLLQIFLANTATDIAYRLDLDRLAGAKAFLLGVEFYASAFNLFSGLPELPVQRSAIELITDGNQIDVLGDGYRQLDETAKSFCNLFERAASTVPQYDSIKACHAAMLVGAGALHLVVTESNRVNEEIAALEQLFEVS